MFGHINLDKLAMLLPSQLVL